MHPSCQRGLDSTSEALTDAEANDEDRGAEHAFHRNEKVSSNLYCAVGVWVEDSGANQVGRNQWSMPELDRCEHSGSTGGRESS